ncbi:amidohydrolase [Halieaceae bacterium IMCC14734]|uniref:Amidohydrolase n=2 Tax=Candidatus Litorirhabdus singularis TaxID=2518993 RepID=A0ABT3TI42_9GAMM|nr:amidohydrolase [Candidatus Litorirhabdus singularis]
MQHAVSRVLCAILWLGATGWAHAAEQSLLQLYQYLHANPELSYQEQNTAAVYARELKAAGFEVTVGVGGAAVRERLQASGATLTDTIGGHGVVGVLRNGDGPVLMIRADMDGLPVAEQTGLSFASKAQGIELTGQPVAVMHACGHDMHMAVAIGTARGLAAERDKWRGTLVIIGQPAEERGAGARSMLEDGLFEQFPRPDYNLALHVSPTLAAGTVGYVSGFMMANVDSVDITVRGVGSHGAYPHMGKDPVVLSAAIITSLQTLVSREIAALEPAVVTVGSIHGGSKHNIIPDRVDLQLTVRSYSDAVRQKLLTGIERIALNQARALGFDEDLLPLVTVKQEYTPALWNDPALVARTVAAFERALGAEQVQAVEKVMGGEDFARYGRTEPRIPGFMFRLGTVSPQRYAQAQAGDLALPSLHSPFFYPDVEPTLATGVSAMTAAALELLR